MRFIPLLLMTLATAGAQMDAAKMLGDGLRSVVAGVAPVPDADRAEILKVTADTLTKHMTFREDGYSSAICTAFGRRQPAEWKKFAVSHIQAGVINEADRLNGVSKRYLIAFSCDAHRTWDAKTNAWGKWYPIGNVLFPSGISIEQRGGKWVANETVQIKNFVPGPGQPAITSKPDPRSQGLPPGMTRGR